MLHMSHMSCVVMCRCVDVCGCVWVSVNVRGCALVRVQNCSWVGAGMLGCVCGVRVCADVRGSARVCEYTLVCPGVRT